MARLRQSNGDCCVVIDCDLQHPPEKIVEMYRLWEAGYEVVEGFKADQKKTRQRLTTRGFYSLLSRTIGFDMRLSFDFKLIDRKVVDVIAQMNEKTMFFRAITFWNGFKTATVYYDVNERKRGKSKCSNASLVKYATHNISAFTTAPMQIVTVLGVVMLIVSLIFGTIVLVQKLSGIAVEGFTTVIILQLFSSSVIMISLGIVGYYQQDLWR